LNVDAGTMNPLEHGEVFVTEDGLETDQDLGHYERFLDQNLTRKNYLTAGQIYLEVIQKERQLGFEGKCVEAYVHIPLQLIKYWEDLGKETDFVLVEMGGTVGEYQNALFFEAARRLKIKYPNQVLFAHVVYLPIPASIGEMKSKPAQQSITSLNSLGIYPDFVVCRSEMQVDLRRKEKIGLTASLPQERIFSAPDVDSIYKVPLILKDQNFDKILLKLVGLSSKKKDLKEWEEAVKKISKAKKEIRIAMVGKYYKSGGFSLEDSYVSVIEAIKHAGWHFGYRPKIVWIDSEGLEKKQNFQEIFKDIQAIIVPGGFGKRGVEGKILAIKYARENKIPFLGLCYGMQLASIEIARNLLGLKDANTTENEPEAKNPVIFLMSDQEKKMLEKDYGGTMRLGAWPCKLKKGTISANCYGQKIVFERHRHRYEFNNKYRQVFEKAGVVIAGKTPDDKIVEIIEMPKSIHPFFVGVQFHPEFQSRFLRPHPLFLGLVKAVIKK